MSGKNRKIQRFRYERAGNAIDSNSQLRKVANGGICFINHAVAASEEEVDVLPTARAVCKTAAVHTKQVAFGCVGKFSVLSRIENHNTAITKLEQYRRLLEQPARKRNRTRYQIKGKMASQSARVKIGGSREVNRVPLKFTS